jgi:hypothetical protein
MGARAMGMGYASSCLQDEFALFNNPAGLAELRNTSFSFSSNVHPSFKPFNRMAATVAFPFRIGVVSAGAFRFGDDLYNEQVFSTAFANKFGLASLGLKVNYIQYHAESFGTKGIFTVSFGGIAELTKKFFIGAHITNINTPRISEEESAPTRLTLGIGIKASEKTFVTTELEKDLTHKTIFRTGIEYQFHKKFVLRTGFNFNPESGFFGLGFRPKRFSIDYALAYKPAVGINHQATAAFKFSKT